MNQVAGSATINEQEHYITGLDNVLIQTRMEQYKNSLATYFTQKMSDGTVGDVLGEKRTVLEDRSFLLGTLPYKKAVIGTEFSVIPDNLRHRISFYMAVDDFDDTPLQAVKSLPEIAGKKISMSYRPATANDEAVINSFMPEPHPDGSPIQPEELPQSLPAYSINVVPELRIDGELLALGQLVGLGTDEIFTIQFYDPSINPAPIVNTVRAGEYFAVGLNVGRTSQTQVERLRTKLEQIKVDFGQQQTENIPKEKVLGEIFFATAMLYHAGVDINRYIISKTIGTASANLPSEAFFWFTVGSGLSLGYTTYGERWVVLYGCRPPFLFRPG